MSNVVSLERTWEYLVERAARHRRAGRYDEAMTLLTRAKTQVGLHEEIELGFARAYDEMGCEEEAERAYLRVARLGGEKRAEAYFQLALSSAQRADLQRAASYFERFLKTGGGDIPQEAAGLLGQQIRAELERPKPVSARGRARELERRAVERLQEGKTAAAERTLRHAVSLHASAQGYTLLACCCLLRGEGEEAVRCAKTAHVMAPARIQTLCVLADALALTGDAKGARRALTIAAMRAGDPEDLLGVAMESAKCGEDALTLRLTERLLKMDPFCTRGMMMRACALTNLGRLEEASRLFGRLCVLTPEDTVPQAFYRMTRDGKRPAERLALGTDVTRQEAASRALQLITALYEDPEQEMDGEHAAELCRLSAWALRSALAGGQTAIVALLVMSGMQTEASREVLRDALTDPQVPDGLKTAILTEVAADERFAHCDVDMGGQLVRLAAGGTAAGAPSRQGQEIVQEASDALSADYPDAPAVLLPMWLAYLSRRPLPGNPQERRACIAALELLYHRARGRHVDERVVASRCGVSARLCRLYAGRIVKAYMAVSSGQAEQTPEHEMTDAKESNDEVH
ncbi:MAG: hypothetical protein PUH70_09795 [Clostridiales bacterium]|nr:hypothetical protein [Clostridiales bacterium]MDY5515124.1 hypothetical protein [Candidatus Ventricola sp.]